MCCRKQLCGLRRGLAFVARRGHEHRIWREAGIARAMSQDDRRPGGGTPCVDAAHEAQEPVARGCRLFVQMGIWVDQKCPFPRPLFRGLSQARAECKVVPHIQSSTFSQNDQSATIANISKGQTRVDRSSAVVPPDSTSRRQMSAIVGTHFPSVDTGLRDSIGRSWLIHENREPAALSWPAPPSMRTAVQRCRFRLTPVDF
jgi:hypothetical protein